MGNLTVFAANVTVEQWRAVEIVLTSTHAYTDPFQDVDVSATFVGPGNLTITRPAFWDGDLNWKVRFAPPQTGTWTMTTNATDVANSGLHNQARTIQCNAYTGYLTVYKHGFLKAKKGVRYLTYADGTPFFYLGDTHWILPHERFDISNVPGVASQFKYTVDKRVAQGFTVIQSEPIWKPHGGTHTGADEEEFADLTNGFTSIDLIGFANIDRKFTYIADHGLVHANAEIDWSANPAKVPIFTEAYMARLAKYWVARYGAYPVIWTIAQEIDKNLYDNFDSLSIRKWFAAAQSISDQDAYQHPILPHMENTGSTTPESSWWSDKPYHDGWAVQWLGEKADMSTAKKFWTALPTKPSILYESEYDQFATDTRGALGSAYKAFQYGLYGYGYGANGIWNDIYSKSGDPSDFGTAFLMPGAYYWWYDGANLKTGDLLTYFKKFYTSLEWWKLIPRFDDKAWSSLTEASRAILSSNGQGAYVVFFFGTGTATGTLNNIASGVTYIPQWFNPRDGKYTDIGKFLSKSNQWTIPARPTAEDWVLLVRDEVNYTKIMPEGHRNLSAPRLSVSSNPASGWVDITFDLPWASNAEISIVDCRGQMAASLGSGVYPSGLTTVTWETPCKSKGVYFAVLKVSGKTYQQRILQVR